MGIINSDTSISAVTNTGDSIDVVGVLVVEHQHTSAVVHGLEPWTNYSVSVAAATQAGVGAPSEPLICATLEDGM